MTLNGPGKYCNPSVENIAKEIFLAMKILFAPYPDLWIENVRLYETPNCYTDCNKSSISQDEMSNFCIGNRYLIEQYRNEKGIVQYDDRKL
jgi:6-pyruvoyltetrahydropterin/6-carboxytetrahydropterin synthase